MPFYKENQDIAGGIEGRVRPVGIFYLKISDFFEFFCWNKVSMVIKMMFLVK